MKKKIKNLTKKDIDRLCDNNYEKYNSCDYCPLNTGVGMCLKYLNLDLNQKIEVSK